MKFIQIIFLVLFSLSAIAEEKKPTFSFTYNAMETLGFYFANKILIGEDKAPVTHLPFHFDANVKLQDQDRMDLSLGFVYIYKDYNKQRPAQYLGLGRVNSGVIWTNEIFLLLGIRFSLLNTGLEGLYFLIRSGIGSAISPQYFNLSVLAQPEIGYTIMFGNPGFTLNFGLGVLLNLPLYETLPFMAPYSTGNLGTSVGGIVFHYAIPVINIGLGFNL